MSEIVVAMVIVVLVAFVVIGIFSEKDPEVGWREVGGDDEDSEDTGLSDLLDP